MDVDMQMECFPPKKEDVLNPDAYRRVHFTWSIVNPLEGFMARIARPRLDLNNDSHIVRTSQCLRAFDPSQYYLTAKRQQISVWGLSGFLWICIEMHWLLESEYYVLFGHFMFSSFNFFAVFDDGM